MTSTSTAVRTIWTPYGSAALGALAVAVSEGQGGDPLAPVTVITPSPAVAVAVRRALAGHLGGVVGVGFHSLGGLAELLAASEVAASGIDVGVDREMLVAAVRVALDEQPGTLAPIRHHRSTWEAIAATIAELDAVDETRLAAVAAGGGIPAEMARIRAMVRDRVGGVGADAVAKLAAAMVADGRARLDEIGPIVVYLPDRLAATDRDLLAALADRVPVTVLIGTAGNASADAAFAAGLGAFDPPPPPPVPPTPATVVVSANDIDDEVRAAVRRLLATAESGTPLDRLALVHPPSAPYTRVVHDVLTETGVPFSGPSTMTLAQTAVGRLLLSAIEVARTDFARDAVIDLWSAGIVVDDEGQPIPFAALDERTRRLGIIDGAGRWTAALDADDHWLTERLGQIDDPEESRYAEHLRRWQVVNAQVRRNLERLVSLIDGVPASWDGVAGWAADVIGALCGQRARRTWPDVDLDAEQAIVTVLGRLASLDRVEPGPGRRVVFDTIATALDQPAPRATKVGAGLLVTTFGRPPVVPLDGVAVVGLVEGHAPRPGRDDVLLGDALRVELGLGGRDEGRLREQRGFEAAVASASAHRILTAARHDQRSGRALVPSRWLVDAITTATGVRPDVEDLMAGRPVTGVDVVSSFSAGLTAVATRVVSDTSRALGDGAPLHDDERTFAALVAAGGIDGAAAADDELRARATLVRSRQARAFTRFDGNLDGAGPDITGPDAVLSPTSLETYAACPRRWFFAHGLGLSTVDRPERVDRIKPTDRGSLVHLVLERFFGEMIDAGDVPPRGVPWSAAAVSRADAICTEECDALERRGLTGHPRRWEHDRDEIHKVVRHALATDVHLRDAFGVQPAAVEFTFGRAGAPPLVVDLGDGRSLALAGQADRVDLGPDRAVVWDYKYANTRPFEVLSRDEDDGGDPLGFGRKLQLVTYGLAASEVHDVGEIHAWYWFLPRTAERRTTGYQITDELRERFRAALRVLADGIGDGRFPARPGEFQWHWGTYEACGWCDFDEICPADRDEEWVRVRLDPGLRTYRRLVEDGSRALVDGDER